LGYRPGDERITPPKWSSDVQDYIRLYEHEALEVERYASQSYWDARYHRLRMARVRTILANLVKLGRTRFLDAGCGTGEYLAMASGLGARVAGVDLARNYVVRARTHCPQGDVVQASLNALPFSDDAMNLVLCSEVLEHLPNDVYETALCELLRITDGIAIVTTPNNGIIRTLGTTLLRNRVAELDSSVGHIAIFPISQLVRRLQNTGWRVISGRTVHIMPPIVGEVLHLPRACEPLVARIEAVLDAVLPRRGNISIVLCRSAVGLTSPSL